MSTATTNAPQAGAPTTAAPPPQKTRQELTAAQCADLFDQILQGDPKAFGRVLVEGFERNISVIRDVLPEKLKPDAERFVKRAALYFQRSPKLEKCTTTSKIRCVIEAAEMGLTLDGKLCHAVAFKNKYKDEKNVERYRDEVKLMLDYKGLVQVAKNSGQIVDAQAKIVRANDQFKHGIHGPSSYLEHTYDITVNRGEAVGAYSRIWLPGGLWIYELMQVDEIEAVRKRSKAANDGPWVTDWDQMAGKTVLRRQLKLYSNDPTIAKAIEVDEREYTDDDSGDWIKPPTTSRAKPSSLNETLGRRTAAQHDSGNGNSGGNGNSQRQTSPPQSREAVETLPEFGDAREPGDEPGDDASGSNGSSGAGDGDYSLGPQALHYEDLLHAASGKKAEIVQIKMDLSSAFTRKELTAQEAGHLQGIVKYMLQELEQKQ